MKVLRPHSTLQTYSQTDTPITSDNTLVDDTSALVDDTNAPVGGNTTPGRATRSKIITTKPSRIVVKARR